MRHIWIVVPAYNEAEILGETLDQLRLVPGHVIVVDDGSTDATFAIARARGVSIVKHPINLGQGAALATGIAVALDRGATHICTFDADGQHDPSTLGELVSALDTEGVDVALASRFLGTSTDMSIIRKAVLRMAVVFTRLHTGLNLTDTHNGLRAFTRSAATKIQIHQPRMAHGSEILAQIGKLQIGYVEVPTIVRYTAYSRRKGQSLFDCVKIIFDLAYGSIAR